MLTPDIHNGLMSPRTRYNLALCFWATILFVPVCAVLGYIVALSLNEVDPIWGCFQGVFIGLLIGLSNSVIYTFYLEGSNGLWIRRLPFLAAILIRSTLTILTVAVSIRLAPVLLPPLSTTSFNWFETETTLAVILGCFAILCLSLMMEINRLLGQGVLRNFVKGRYHRPNEEKLLFLFIDIVGSTSIAERVAPKAFHAMLDTFARDLSDAVLDCGGRIHKYVGDGIIITWPAEQDQSVLLAIRCYVAFKQRVYLHRKQYLSDFGHFPEFRGALHGGPVVVGEMGDLKREIVYLGDTVNTVSRIIAAASLLDEDFLVSTNLIEGISLPLCLAARKLGPSHLRGRDMPVELSSLSWNQNHPPSRGLNGRGQAKAYHP